MELSKIAAMWANVSFLNCFDLNFVLNYKKEKSLTLKQKN